MNVVYAVHVQVPSAKQALRANAEAHVPLPPKRTFTHTNRAFGDSAGFFPVFPGESLYKFAVCSLKHQHQACMFRSTFTWALGIGT